MKPLQVALIHDWLTGMRGGEAVFEAIAELFPQAHLFTLISYPEKISKNLSKIPCTTSFLQKFPKAEEKYRYFLPLMPKAIESFDLRSYDLILSSSHCVAKGVLKKSDAVHISYVHAPMRYMWDRFEDYFGSGKSSFLVRIAALIVRPFFKAWDKKSSQAPRVDHLIANSRFIASQIKAHYNRSADVIYPFLDFDFFNKPREPGKNYLMVGAFAPYKRIDLAIQAFNQLKLPLLIVGSGQDEKKLKTLAGPTVQFLGSLSRESIADLYSKCRAFVFPGIEDFGITPLEAMASGAPVIAFRKGGVTETVTEQTGVFFNEPTVESLIEAIRLIETGKKTFDEAFCRKRAYEFIKERFQKEYIEVIRRVWKKVGKDTQSLDNVLAQGPGRVFLRLS